MQLWCRVRRGQKEQALAHRPWSALVNTHPSNHYGNDDDDLVDDYGDDVDEDDDHDDGDVEHHC